MWHKLVLLTEWKSQFWEATGSGQATGSAGQPVSTCAALKQSQHLLSLSQLCRCRIQVEAGARGGGSRLRWLEGTGCKSIVLPALLILLLMKELQDAFGCQVLCTKMKLPNNMEVFIEVSEVSRISRQTKQFLFSLTLCHLCQNKMRSKNEEVCLPDFTLRIKINISSVVFLLQWWRFIPPCISATLMELLPVKKKEANKKC